MNERPSATCGTVEQGVAAVGLSPTLLSVLCLGLHELLSATVGRSDELALLATNLHIYMEVSLYREAGGGGLQACRQRLLGLPEHVGQQLSAKVTRLLCGSSGCWCSHGLCGVRDGAGTATPALATAAGHSKDHKCTINQERT